ncbi:uncharacterized protein LOC100826896 isoform X2 [Brachypodium distachyon]|uniref:uncharacterized protein LOC100826896 isoform X2 n=1 Tax=Brachypodium distachyon TaxID=15368 RepID=UPI00071CBBD4|nr:uncharacterized protein LOC100826896 isoform X2 [Brachypodium distachyon]|eukprot:XP_014751930.1 uncharacterized protein LOC100826896 isoform X2 [Brachypodium distachyon]
MASVQGIESLAFDRFVQLEVDRKIGTLLQAREENALREKLLNAQRFREISADMLEGGCKPCGMGAGLSVIGTNFSDGEFNLHKSDASLGGEEVSGESFAAKVQGLQGLPLVLTEIDKEDDMGDQLANEVTSGGGLDRDDRDAALRRSSRLELQGRSDDKVEDRAIFNAKIKNLKIPKGGPPVPEAG